MKSMQRTLSAIGATLIAVLSLTACGGQGGGSAGNEAGGLPKQLVWSTYGTGTATYADVAAVADSITANQGTSVRILTSDTAIGRMGPLKNKQAVMSRTGEEYIYSFEADYDFATEAWGPQDVRMVWAPVAPHGLLVKDSSRIKSFEDLKGAKVPRITANPSVNNKITAMLAYAGLTWDDVQPVDISYSDQPGGVKSGQLDVLYQQVYGASLYELESAFPVRWLSMDDESPEKVAAVKNVVKSVEIGEFTGAPGQAEGESQKGFLYTLPLIAYSETEESTVYETVKAIQDNYDKFKDTTATTKDWSVDAALTVPVEVPFHAGTVKFLKEQGAWSDEAETKNQELIERGEKLRAGWKEFVGSADKANLVEEWAAWKKANVPAS